MLSSPQLRGFIASLMLACLGLEAASLEKQITTSKPLVQKPGPFKVVPKASLSLPPISTPKATATTPPQIAVRRPLPKPLVAGPPSKGNWQQVKDGFVWSAELAAEDAHSLRVHFANLELPAGATITLYNPDNPQEIAGPYDASFFAGREDFWSGAIFNSRLIIECFVPSAAQGAPLHFIIDELSHRYRELNTFDQSKAAGSCNLDVTCYPEWASNAKAVAAMTVITRSGESLCTGTLIADQNSAPGTDYFLTAHHCVANQFEADAIEFYWFFQTSACNGIPPDITSVPRTVGGAQFLIAGNRDNSTDFSLLRLRQSPPAGVTYAGWTTDLPPQNSTVAVIHHPDFDYKRISFGRVVSIMSNFWEVGWNLGVTEPGSSGAPLFNDSGQIIGTLFGGSSSCQNPSGTDEFGRFDQAYPFFSNWLNNLPVAVANDNFANAAPLSGIAGSFNFSNGGATEEIGEPDHAGNAGGMSLWYLWTSPTNGTISFDTFGSAFDTTLAVYTGNTLGSLVQVAQNDDALDRQSRAAFLASAGATYYIAVDGFDGAAGPGILSWMQGTASQLAANDDFESAATLAGIRGDISSHNLGSGTQPGEPQHASVENGSSVWYNWIAPRNGLVSFDTEFSNFDTVLAVYRGAAVSSLTPVASNDDIPGGEVTSSRVTFNAVSGALYRIAVDGFNGEQGNVLLTWTMAETAPAPANDNFASAAQITGIEGSTGANTLAATLETGEPPHEFLTGNSVWFSWTAPQSGILFADTHGSDFDTSLAVYSGTSLASLVRLAQNDDAGFETRSSALGVRVVANAVYKISLAGVQTTSGIVRAGNAQLNWQLIPDAGNNDLFANAFNLQGIAGTIRGINFGAGKEPGEPSHAGVGGRSVWHQWTAPGTGMVIFETIGSTFDTTLAAYTGSNVASLQQITANDDAGPATLQSEIRFSATAGTTYYIAVDGYNSNGIVEEGIVNLSWAQLMLSLSSVHPSLTFQLSGTTNHPLTIEYSSDLETWDKLTNTVLRATLDTISIGPVPESDYLFFRTRLAD